MTPQALGWAAIDRLLCDSDFSPDKVVMVLDLPGLQMGDTRCVTMEEAIQTLELIGARLHADPQRVAEWRSELHHAAADGFTPVCRLWAVADRAYISVDGVRLTPSAKA